MGQIYYEPQDIKLEITVSIGIYGPHRAKDEKKALERVDQALYWAKEAGKDQIKVYKKERAN